jgi:hypothetical protein
LGINDKSRNGQWGSLNFPIYATSSIFQSLADIENEEWGKNKSGYEGEEREERSRFVELSLNIFIDFHLIWTVEIFVATCRTSIKQTGKTGA